MADVEDERRTPFAVLMDLVGKHDDDRVRQAMRSARDRASDPVDIAALSLFTLLRWAEVVDIDRFVSPRWLALRPSHRVALLLHEVEQIPMGRAADLLSVTSDQFRQAYEGACAAMGWEPLERVACAGWPTVARLHRLGTEDGEVGIIHLEHCPKCAMWHFDRQDRRIVLADIAPFIGATGLGYLWDPASI